MSQINWAEACPKNVCFISLRLWFYFYFFASDSTWAAAGPAVCGIRRPHLKGCGHPQHFLSKWYSKLRYSRMGIKTYVGLIIIHTLPTCRCCTVVNFGGFLMSRFFLMEFQGIWGRLSNDTTQHHTTWHHMTQHTTTLHHKTQKKFILIHCSPESNLVKFEIPETLTTESESSWHAYFEFWVG